MQAAISAPLYVVPSRARVEAGAHPCGTCPTRALCWNAQTTARRPFDAVHLGRRRLKRGESLFHMGSTLQSLYVVRSGNFKSTTLMPDGREQVTGYHMNGDVLGLCGIETQTYQVDCVALEDSEVCVLPYEQVTATATRDPSALRDFLRLMSQGLHRQQGVMAALGTLHADERVAMFLLDLSERQAQRGLSARSFVLRMTREEIGSYLGLKLETVSRVLARFQGAGLITIAHSREITLNKPDGLRALLLRESSPPDMACALASRSRWTR